MPTFKSNREKNVTKDFKAVSLLSQSSQINLYRTHRERRKAFLPSFPSPKWLNSTEKLAKKCIKTHLLWQQSYCWTPQDSLMGEEYERVPRVRHGWLPSSSTLLSDNQWFWAFLGAVANLTFWELSSSKCSSLPLLPSLSHSQDLGTELEVHGGSKGKATADSLSSCRDTQSL